MIARLLSIWFAIRASYWFYPALSAISSLVLSLVLVHLDRTGATGWMSNVDWLHQARPQSASNMLTVIAGSMIGVAATVFSITIAAVAYASGTYGPRLLTNFMEDRGNKLSLATFVGTFVFAISVLRSVRMENESAAMPFADPLGNMSGFVPQLSLLVAFALMILSVGVLVYFLHHIPSGIRINAVLEGIGRHLMHKIEARFPELHSRRLESGPVPAGRSIVTLSTGYIRYIGLQELDDVARQNELRIGLAVRTGDFVHRGLLLARVDGDTIPERLEDEIRGCFALGASRTPEQDLEFSIDELVEIAMRALSPGLNDPFTAITAIHWLGAATAELGRRRLNDESGGAKGSSVRIIPLHDGFDHFVSRGFGAARSSLATSKLAALAAFEAIRNAAEQLTDGERVDLLAREGDLLMRQAELALDGPDLEELAARHGEFRKAITAGRAARSALV